MVTIKNILLEAAEIIELDFSNEILEELKLALSGFSHLKETYKGDYYIISDIDKIIETINNKIEKSENMKLICKHIQI